MNRVALPAVERNLYLPALAGFFVTGVWLGHHVTAGPWPLWLLALALALIVPMRILRLPLRLICLPLALMLALFWTQHWLHPETPAEGMYNEITATVYGDSRLSDTGNVTFRVTDVSLDGVPQAGKAYAIIYMDENDEPVELTDGMRIRFRGNVYKPYPNENEHDFNFRTWMRLNGLRYGIRNIEDIQRLSGQTQWADYAQRIAGLCHRKLQTVMGDRADLAVAMLLGYRDALAEDDEAAFRRAGVAHVMAVSGLHVGVLSLSLLWLLEKLRLRKKLQIPVLAVFLLAYCGITGFAVSSMRAGVMMLLWVTGRAYGRRTNPVTIVSAAVLIVLIINPLQLFSAGFALSFAAIAGIFLLYPRIIRMLNRVFPVRKVKKGRTLRYVLYRIVAWIRPRQLVAVSLSAQLGVLLPVAAYYHHIYLCGIAFNLLIVPIVGVLVPLYAVTALTLFLPWIGGWIGIIPGTAASLGSEFVLWLVRWSNAVPWAEIRVAEPNIWVYLAVFTGMAAVSHFVRAPVRRRLFAIGAVVMIALVGSYAQRPAQLRYHQFAAGWADSALIIDGGTTIGIDTGNTGSAMINRLLAEGRNLDALILTHLHADHAGGVEAILDEGIQIQHVYLPVDYEEHGYGEDSLAGVRRLKEEGVPVTTLKAGDTLRFHETTINVRWPQEGRTRGGIDPNDRSLAMLVTLGGVRILSMADNGMLYENYAAVSADILKSGHHGSTSSSGETFLQAVDPALAIITVRADTSLPAQSTLERFAAQGIQVLRTDETGEITIVPVRGGYRVYQYLSEETH